MPLPQQTVNQFLPLLSKISKTPDVNRWIDALLEAIATHLVANRPDRIEPRAVKK